MAAVKLFLYLFIILISITKLDAEPINGDIVVIQVLDKITARIYTIDIAVGKSANFGSLKIDIYQCKKRPPEEIPEDFVLLKIMDEVSLNIFKESYKGWMISSSPSTTPFEHPTYDVWIKDCKTDIESE